MLHDGALLTAALDMLRFAINGDLVEFEPKNLEFRVRGVLNETSVPLLALY
jgi:hypothetical protein